MSTPAVLHAIWASLVMSAAMAWQVGWSLVLGFTLSGLTQAVVPKEKMQARLGGSGLREIAIATGLGAASSSCSYAAAAMSKTLFKKGAAAAIRWTAANTANTTLPRRMRTRLRCSR